MAGMDAKVERRRGAFALAALVIVLLLPIAYVLSIGPAAGLYFRGQLSLDAYVNYTEPGLRFIDLCGLNKTFRSYKRIFIPPDPHHPWED